jgi:pimeloyl-ACP methyl ester carboxylesterase
LSATLAYYRAMFSEEKSNPAFSDLRSKMNRPIQVPTRALCGAQDLRAELMLDQSKYFAADYDFQLVDQAGHFLHREQAPAVTRLILDWLNQ